MSSTFKSLIGSVFGFAEDIVLSAKPAGKAVQYSTAAAAAAAQQALLAIAPSDDEVAKAEALLKRYIETK